MISIPHKAKQFLVLLVKLLIVGGAFYFIYDQLAHNEKLDWQKFITLFRKNQSVLGISFILLLSILNRYFEILKWQNLAKVIHEISVSDATREVLANFDSRNFYTKWFGRVCRKSIILPKIRSQKSGFLKFDLQWNPNGFNGCLRNNWLINTRILEMGFSNNRNIYSLFSIFFLFKKIKIKGYSIEKLLHKINKIPKPIHQKNILLGICRYLVFSHQYYFLFLAFDVDLSYFTLIATISVVYFLASSLPTFQFLDFAVKGSVAIYFFGILGVNEWIVVFISTLMWFLNVVLPVIFGSYYVLNFKTKIAK